MSTFEQFLGSKALGSAVGTTDPAVLVAVKDNTGNAAPLNVDASGNLKVAPSGGGDASAANQVTGNASLSSIDDKLTTIDGHVDGLETAVAVTNTKLDTLHSDNAAATPAGTNNIGKVSPADDQDPIFDHTNGTKTSVTTSATIITPPAGCKYCRIGADTDIFVRTDGQAAVDDGTSIRIIANQPEVVPVTAATAVKALSSSGTAVVRCMPLKTR